jgi:hypothetical protein
MNNDADAVAAAVGLVNIWDLLADPPDLVPERAADRPGLRLQTG